MWCCFLANLYGATGQIQQHARLADSALAIQERLWGRDDPRLAPTIGTVAESRWNTGQLSASEPMLRRMIALAERDTGLLLYSAVHARNLLAISLRDQDRLDEADAVLLEIVADRERVDRQYPAGLDHALTGLGHIAIADGRPAEAARYYREVLGRRRNALGASHPEVANTLINLARALGRSGTFDEAFALFEEGLAMRRVTQGADHAEIGVDLVGLGDVQMLAADTTAARRSYRDALVRLLRTHGAAHPLTREVMQKLGAESLASPSR